MDPVAPDSPTPEHGSRLLHQTLDHFSRTQPNRLYASVPISSELSEGFRDVSFKDMGRCSDFVANWIQDSLGRSNTFETICYIGIPDLRSAAFFFGAVKCGYKVLFPSPRNPASTNISLLEQTNCFKIIFAEEVGPIVKQLQVLESRLQASAIPSFETILKGDGRSFSYKTQAFQDAKNNPIVVLHSSGSTGLPKPITMTHGTFAILDNERNLPTVPGRKNRDFSIWDFSGGGKFYHVFPYFHLAGFLSNIVNPTFTEASSPVLGPALLPPSGTLLKEIMQQQNLRALYIPPAIAEQLLQEPQGIEFFRDLDFLCYTGAPFSPAAGKQLVEVTELVSLYGSTEAFQVPQLVPSKEDWAYMEWNPNFKLEMQPSEDEKGAFEMVLFADESTERMSALNHNLPDTKEWRTKDLFLPHPTKPNLWTYFGRRDDIIVLSNSEKFNPVPMELKIQGHPLLAGALVVGHGRVRASLLVEPKPSVQGDARQSLIGEIWSRVEEANGLVPGHGRIIRSNIIIANRPFTRAGKGTIVRKLTEKDFENEIETLYAAGKATTVAEFPTLIAPFDRRAIVIFLRAIIASCFPAAGAISDSDDLFSYGLDSLIITELVATLKSAIQPAVSSDVSWISPVTIYQNPTVFQLASILEEFLRSGKIPRNDNKQVRIAKMKHYIELYTKDLTSSLAHNPSSQKAGLSIAMTGSTGSLGTVILAELLAHPDVSRIYCLLRGHGAKERQQKILLDRGIEESKFSKLEFMTVDIGEPKLGLTAENFGRLVDDVDIILHNAWKVDFNLSLQSFQEPYLRSVQSLVDLSCVSKQKARIYFVTSVSAVMNSLSVIAESPALDFSAVLEMGYSESKCAAEGILAKASEKSGVPVTILRVAQCGGSTVEDDPPWPKHEWLYPVLKASKSLGIIPSSLAPIDWIPINQVASIISEIITSSVKRDSLQVFNIVNPTPVSWEVLVEVLQERFPRNATTASLREWCDEVKRHNVNELAGPILEPALRLLGQLGEGKESIRYVTETTSAVSKTFALVKPIDKQLLALWLDQWGL